MKVEFLNIWDAKVDESKQFLKEESNDTDVFCFQEAFDGGLSVISQILKNYRVNTARKFVRRHFNFAQATFVRNDIEVLETQVLFETGETGIGIYTQFRYNGEVFNLINFHGMPPPGDKLDTPLRIKQSEDIIEYFAGIRGLKIIGGDFNLEINTKSIGLFEKNGYRNLIKEFKIDTTRNRFAWELYPDNKQLYSDYVFVSSDVMVKKFQVPKNEISDHLPMILEIEI